MQQGETFTPGVEKQRAMIGCKRFEGVDVDKV
jgi:hypothetical protein